MLESGIAKLQYEAAWCLTNIGSGTSEQTISLIKTGCVPLLCQLIQSETLDLKIQSIWALGNIAGNKHIVK